MGVPALNKQYYGKLEIDFVLSELVKSGIIDVTDSDKIKSKANPKGVHPLVIISKNDIPDRRPPHNKITLDSYMKWLAHWCGKEYYEIDPLKLDISVITKVLPKAYLVRLGILPVRVTDDTIYYATAEPFDLGWTMEVEQVTRKKTEIVIASPIQINNFVGQFFSVRDALVKFGNENKEIRRAKDQRNERDIAKMFGDASKHSRDDSAIANIVDWLFQFAFDERATDIHLEPRNGEGHIRFRIDGTLRVVYRFSPEVMVPLVSRIKIIANLKVDEKRRPQDGRIKRELRNGQVMEFRVSTIPGHFGEKLVMRIFDQNMMDVNVEDIGLSENDAHTWRKMISRSFGLVLVTGPTGSGKSTTLHASLREVATEEVNVCTVEDPIEIVNHEFNQMQVNEELDITFGNAIRSFLRQDPDIIMVGEIRDKDAGDMAIQASLTGHLVMSTLHTNDALSTITRLIDLGMPPFLINACLSGIMAQRLVRNLCDHCKEKKEINEELWDQVRGNLDVEKPTHLYEAKGCPECKNSGYRGRSCVYELVEIDDEIRELIQHSAPLLEIKEKTKNKFMPIRMNAIQKVLDGETTLEEVLRVVL